MRTGQCQCGAICYESKGEPCSIYICHCKECQRQSASAFGISLDVPQTGFRVTQGTPNYWSRTADSGKTLKCAFCPSCGSRLWHETQFNSATLSIKAGSLDEPLDVSNAIHVWVKRKLPGIIIPADAKQFLEED